MILFLCLVMPIVATAQNLRGASPPECSTDCPEGGCEYSNCKKQVNCQGGGCTFSDSMSPHCGGGGCYFYYCVNPECRGGGCSYVGCQGGDSGVAGDSGLTPQQIRDKANPISSHNTWDQLTDAEKDQLLASPTPPPPPPTSQDDNINPAPKHIYNNVGR